MLDLYAAFAYQLDPVQIAWLATGANIINLPIAFGAGWLMDHFGRKRTMVPGFGGVALSMVALAGLRLHTAILCLVCGAVLPRRRDPGADRQFDPDRWRRRRPPEARGMFLGIGA